MVTVIASRLKDCGFSSIGTPGFTTQFEIAQHRYFELDILSKPSLQITQLKLQKNRFWLTRCWWHGFESCILCKRCPRVSKPNWQQGPEFLTSPFESFFMNTLRHGCGASGRATTFCPNSPGSNVGFFNSMREATKETFPFFLPISYHFELCDNRNKSEGPNPKHLHYTEI